MQAHLPWFGVVTAAIAACGIPANAIAAPGHPSSTALTNGPPLVAQIPAPSAPPEDVQDLLDSIDQALPERPSDPAEDIPEALPEQPTPGLDLPTPAAPPPEPTVPQASFPIREIDVRGSTVLKDEIQTLVQAYLERGQITFDDLLTLRSEITQLYIENDYVTSGAFLPSNQLLTDGSVTIQVVEGSVETIQVEGNRHLNRGYVRDRLALATGTPLNQAELLEALQLLQLDPFISQVNAELTAGATPGQNALLVTVGEPSPFSAGVGSNNYRPVSIGSAEISTNLGYSNLFGIGDRITGSYGRTDGLDIFDTGFSVPVNARDGTFSFRFNSSESQIIDDEFEDLEIESQTRTYGLSYRQPVVRSPQTEFALGLGFDLRRRQTFILDDIPFSFSVGPEEGESNVSVLRFSQDWVNRSERRVLAARSQFSFGLDAFNATVNDSGIDGRFFNWVGQFQWVQQLSERNLVITRLSTQLTPDSLLSLEQFSIGGVDTVRGYAQNQLVGDNGVLAGVEFRIPVTRNPQRLQLTPFIEMGTVWNNSTPDPEDPTIAGVGLGLRWLVIPSLSARLDYGIPLVDIDSNSDSLQDNGLYLSVNFQPF
ncbi:MAG: ShlB/FhaC/HecB family hemolysin secretion/activation protein [Cyanobacteria bacterium P01_A01_bin.135]